jgi:hypothetical protein
VSRSLKRRRASAKWVDDQFETTNVATLESLGSLHSIAVTVKTVQLFIHVQHRFSTDEKKMPQNTSNDGLNS